MTNDEDYLKLISDSVPIWVEEFKEVNDKRVLWDLLKYRIRQVSITYSKGKARIRKQRLSETEQLLKLYQEKCAIDPSKQNIEQLESLKNTYDSYFDYLSKGAIIRSRACWYEKGEKNTKYFLTLESQKKAKSCIRKVYTKKEVLSSDPKVIMNELEEFYKVLYEIKNDPPDELLNVFLENPKIPKLSPDQTLTSEGKLTVNECYESLNSLEENKSPGNDGLTVEFYKTFWELKIGGKIFPH